MARPYVKVFPKIYEAKLTVPSRLWRVTLTGSPRIPNRVRGQLSELKSTVELMEPFQDLPVAPIAVTFAAISSIGCRRTALA